jgi:hypothetical protein
VAAVLGAALLLAAVVILVRRARRAAAPEGRAQDGRAAGAPGAAPGRAHGEPAPGVLDALDARASVIARYAALEGELGRRIRPRAAAETPEELLDRADAAGLGTPAARRLAAHYAAARFSTRPVTVADRRRAGAALAAARRAWHAPGHRRGRP